MNTYIMMKQALQSISLEQDNRHLERTRESGNSDSNKIPSLSRHGAMPLIMAIAMQIA